MEVAHDLLERALHAEELVLEEVVDLDRLVAEHPLRARVGLEVEIRHTPAHHHVVHALVGEVGEARALLHELEVLQERAGPLLLLAVGAVLLGDGFAKSMVSPGMRFRPCWLV